MRTIIAGFSGWARMRDTESESVRMVDTALTIVGTLLVAVTWVMLRN